MAAIEQSRLSDPSATQATAVAGESASSAGAALSIRLWRAGGTSSSGDLSWQGTDAAVCLILDLIAAGQIGQTGQAGETGRAGAGVATTADGKYLVAAFSGITAALLTARRLQWALAGFAETGRFAGTAAAVLVHSKADLPALASDSSVLLPLEKAAAGQILLTPKAAELLQDLPGLPLQATSEAGLSEVLWHAAEATSSGRSDEEALSQFIQLHGSEVEAPAPSPSPAPEPIAPAAPAAPFGTDRGLRALPVAVEPDAVDLDAVESGEFDSDDSVASRRVKPGLLIGAGCTAAILLVLIVVFAVSHKGVEKPAAVAEQPAASIAAPASSASQPLQGQAASSVPQTTAAPAPPTKHNEAAQKDRKHEDAAQGNPSSADAAKAQDNLAKPDKQAKAVGGNCDLDSNLLPKMLEQAERSRAEGNYPAALRQFRAVLACDPHNARARSGLDLTEFGMQHR
jgi:hypothetical protein